MGKTKSALGLVGDLSTAVIDKAIELNDKYQIVDKTGKVIKEAAGKVKESIDKAQA